MILVLQFNQLKIWKHLIKSELRDMKLLFNQILLSFQLILKLLFRTAHLKSELRNLKSNFQQDQQTSLQYPNRRFRCFQRSLRVNVVKMQLHAPWFQFWHFQKKCFLKVDSFDFSSKFHQKFQYRFQCIQSQILLQKFGWVGSSYLRFYHFWWSKFKDIKMYPLGRKQ